MKFYFIYLLFIYFIFNFNSIQIFCVNLLFDFTLFILVFCFILFIYLIIIFFRYLVLFIYCLFIYSDEISPRHLAIDQKCFIISKLNWICVFRAAVGLSDLHWIWILSEHRFTEPALQWISLTVSVLSHFVCCCRLDICLQFRFKGLNISNVLLFWRYHLQQCADIYNLSTSLDDAIQQTNEEYGGYDIRTTRIVFPNGSIDPWHALGVTQDITSDLPAVFIKGLSRLLYFPSTLSPLNLTSSLSLSLRNGSLCKHVPRPSGRPSSAGSGTGPHLHPAPKMAGQVIDSNNSQSDVQLSVMANQVVLLFNGTKEFLALEMHCFYNNLEFEISFVCDNVYESMNECHFFLDVNIFCRRIISIKEILWCQKHDVVIDFLLSCRLFRCVFARRSFSWDVCDNHHDKEPKVHMERNCSPSFVREIGTKYYGSEFIS